MMRSTVHAMHHVEDILMSNRAVVPRKKVSHHLLRNSPPIRVVALAFTPALRERFDGCATR